jgi:hypothetical protein
MGAGMGMGIMGMGMGDGAGAPPVDSGIDGGVPVQDAPVVPPLSFPFPLSLSLLSPPQIKTLYFADTVIAARTHLRRPMVPCSRASFQGGQ